MTRAAISEMIMAIAPTAANGLCRKVIITIMEPPAAIIGSSRKMALLSESSTEGSTGWGPWMVNGR